MLHHDVEDLSRAWNSNDEPHSARPAQVRAFPQLEDRARRVGFGLNSRSQTPGDIREANDLLRIQARIDSRYEAFSAARNGYLETERSLLPPYALMMPIFSGAVKLPEITSGLR